MGFKLQARARSSLHNLIPGTRRVGRTSETSHVQVPILKGFMSRAYSVISSRLFNVRIVYDRHLHLCNMTTH